MRRSPAAITSRATARASGASTSLLFSSSRRFAKPVARPDSSFVRLATRPIGERPMLLETLRRVTRERPLEAKALLLWIVLALVLLTRGALQPHRASTYRFYRDAGQNWLEGRDLYQQIGETCRYSPL